MKTIKSLIIILALIATHKSAFGNFLNVKVTGITCSMCSNSVHKALASLSFIDSIEVDLENAVFKLTFKEGQKVVIDDIKSKIEGAGFSVGELTADFKFNNLSVTKDYHFQFDGNTYHFVGVNNQNLDNITSLKFVDKGFTSTKEFKKYAGMTSMACIKTGKTGKCCPASEKQRIYHVTI